MPDANSGLYGSPGTPEARAKVRSKIQSQAQREVNTLDVNIKDGEIRVKELVAQMDRWKEEKAAWEEIVEAMHDRDPVTT